MTGPVTPPPPSGPGKDGFDADLYLSTVGVETVDALAGWAEAMAARAPELTSEQEAVIRRAFSAGCGVPA